MAVNLSINIRKDVDKLRRSERAFLCRVLNLHGGLASSVHEGNLPFVNKKLASVSLLKMARSVTIADIEKNAAKRLLDKMGLGHITDNMATFVIKLDPRKIDNAVGEYASGYGTLKLPFTVKSKVGIQWQEFGKKWVVPEVQLSHYAEITSRGRGLYRVSCPLNLEQQVKEYIFEKFG